MKRISLIATAAAAALTVAACNRTQAGPETQTTTAVQPTTASVTATGCLRAGLAENTFVLTTPASDSSETSTYQLNSHDVKLRDYVGQQVRVSGTLRSEEQVASSGTDVVGKPAKGTTGTPTIETKTELDVKQMTVSSVTPSGDRCAPEAPKTEPQSERRIK
jgi:hypothetical protein